MYDMMVYSELFHNTCRLQVLCPTRASRRNSPNLYKGSRYASCFFMIFLAGPSELPSYISNSLAFAVSKIRSTYCTICPDTGGLDTRTPMFHTPKTMNLITQITPWTVLPWPSLEPNVEVSKVPAISSVVQGTNINRAIAKGQQKTRPPTHTSRIPPIATSATPDTTIPFARF